MVQRLLDWEIHSARGHTRSDEQISFTNEMGKFGAKPYYTRIINSLRILQFLFCPVFLTNFEFRQTPISARSTAQYYNFLASLHSLSIYHRALLLLVSKRDCCRLSFW